MKDGREPEPGSAAAEALVKRCGELAAGVLEELFAGYGIPVAWVGEADDIPGSFWGAPEAGIVRGTLFVRPDTPVHSALHEGCHLICMGAPRRSAVHTDAGGDEVEEDAVCYLQILMAERLPDVGSRRLMLDMDRWGYSFRLGSARAWFERDAEDAREWLESGGLLPVLWAEDGERAEQAAL